MDGNVKPALASRALASVFGVGFLPLAPGTWASILAALAWYLLQPWMDIAAYLPWLLVLAIVTTGLVSVHRLNGAWGQDPSQVVIDEWAGTWIACLLMPHQPTAILAALVFFRLFDIYKPMGIRRLEKMHGATGIMLDDLLAGIYANVVVHLLLAFHLLK